MASSPVSSSDNENCSLEQVRKLFIGGLNYTTTDKELKEYCSKYGQLTGCSVMCDREGRSRGFAFVRFQDRSMVDHFMEHRPHTINGRTTDVKRAMPRNETSKVQGYLTVKKIFIGGVKEDMNEDELRSSFQQFGNITDCHIVKDKQDQLRGFAFVTFDDYDAVDRCILNKPHIIRGKAVDVRKAIPRLPHSSQAYLPQLIISHPSVTTPFYPSAQVVSQLTSPRNSNNAMFFLPPSFFSHQLYSPSPGVSNPPVKTRSGYDCRTGHRLEQHRKLFIGGLSMKTTDQSLKDYVTTFGEVSDSLVMKDQQGQSKCFGFVTFRDPKTVDEFMKKRPHTLDGRQIDPKRAMPREEAKNDEIHLTVRKIFIGGIRDGLDEVALRLYFKQFGTINDCLFMHDQDGRTRGFAFIEFDDHDSVDKIILARPHVIGDYRVDVKKAVPKDHRQQYTLPLQPAYHNYYPIPYAMFYPNTDLI